MHGEETSGEPLVHSKTLGIRAFIAVVGVIAMLGFSKEAAASSPLSPIPFQNSNGEVRSLLAYGGQLFAGTSNASSPVRLLWLEHQSDPGAPYFADVGGTVMPNYLIPFNNDVYVLGTAFLGGNPDPAAITTLNNYGNAPLWTGPGNVGITAATIDPSGSMIFFGTNNPAGGELWTYSAAGVASKVLAAGINDNNNTKIESLAFIGNYLYVGTNNTNGAQILRTSDLTGHNGWTPVVSAGLNGPKDVKINELRVFGGVILAAVGQTSAPSPHFLWYSNDGATWMPVLSYGGAPGDLGIGAMTVANGHLYVGSNNHAAGAQLWSTPNTTTWTLEASLPAPAVDLRARSFAQVGNTLYVGTGNDAVGTTIIQAGNVYALQLPLPVPALSPTMLAIFTAVLFGLGAVTIARRRKVAD